MVTATSTLLLASQSPVRQQLLKEAHIPFAVIAQDADESRYKNSDVAALVTEIALAKMEQAQVPTGKEVGELCWVLTADSLVQSGTGTIFGKPASHNDAITMLKELRKLPCKVATGFCCERKRWDGTRWVAEQTHLQSVAAEVCVEISDAWIPIYLQKHPYALQTAGVLVVEGYGAQFVKTIQGSYTTILGLPLYELRLALETLGFFGLGR